LSTDVLALDKRIEKIAILRALGTTCTVSEERYYAVALGADRVPLPSYAFPESKPHPATMGERLWNVIDPAPSQAKGVEAAAYLFAKRVARISEVRAVTYATERETYVIWTFIARRNKAVRREAYEQELGLMHEFSAIAFDFNVVALDQIEERPLLPDDLQGRIVFYRE
jgi:hypothetical protein